MTIVQERFAVLDLDSAADRRQTRPSEQPILLAVASVLGLLFVAVGIVVADLVFPEPTMWRVAVTATVIVLGIFPIRGLFRRAGAASAARALADANVQS